MVRSRVLVSRLVDTGRRALDGTDPGAGDRGTPLRRVRAAGLAFGVVSSLGLTSQINTHFPVYRSAAGFAAFATLAAIFLAAFLRGRTFPGEPVLTAGATFAFGVALRDPLATLGLVFSVLIALSLYGSPRSAVARLVLHLVVPPLVLVVSPLSLGRHIPWHSNTFMGLVPTFVMITFLVRFLLVTVVLHQRQARRESVLVRAAGLLLNATDRAEIESVTEQAATDLAATAPGIGAVSVRRDGDAAVVYGSAGWSAELPGGTVLPLELLTGPDLPSGEVPPGTAYLAGLERIVGARYWRVADLPVPDGPRRLFVGGPGRIAADLADAFELLAVQRSFAETRAQSHAALGHQANHDALTGLPNRHLFFERLAGSVDAGVPVALIVIDLDDFKNVNDSYGHPAGDGLLRAVADRLREAAGEAGMPARFGGDEFAIVLPGADERTAVEIADRVGELLRRPVHLPETTVCPVASIGLALSEPQLTAADVMRCADIAMYWAKARGKSRVERYTREEHGDIGVTRMLEEHLPHAVDRDEIVVHYQPHVETDTHRCVGAEALARWQHPTLGLLPPADFIALAERTGQIGTLGLHVLRLACRQTAAWNATAEPPLRIAVNVAARQLLDGDFTTDVATVLAETGLPAARLTLELTESEIIDDPAAVRQLRDLATLGITISIDDFGTGYASLASLRAFPVHQIKIDRSFLADSSGTNNMLPLVISVGRMLNLEMVAEGVETAEQETLLAAEGVPLLQGYRFARPMPADDFARWRETASHATLSTP